MSNSIRAYPWRYARQRRRRTTRIKVLSLIIAVALIALTNGLSAWADAEVVFQDWEGNRVSFDGVKPTDDNPWGFTAGIIKAEEDGQSLFLTPNTSVRIYDLNEDSIIRLKLRIHPWVSGYSDGAGLKIWWLDDSENIIREEVISVGNTADWMLCEKRLADIPGATSVALLCDNGRNDDDSGDWIEIAIADTLPAMTGSVAETEEEAMLVDWKGYRIRFDGETATEDNPWGFTAGVLDNTDLLLTPNTQVDIYAGEEALSDLKLTFRIYTDVAVHSDGADFILWAMDDEDDILEERTYEVSAEVGWTELNVEELHPAATHIQLMCGSGKNNDDICDWVVFRQNRRRESSFARDGYVKSATYFADEWPMNFWNTEFENLNADLQQIRDDGFDSIILIIPWKEFQPTIDPPGYNEYAFSNLKRVVEACRSLSLDIYVRLGYIWDFYNDSNEYIIDRYINLMGDETTRTAWRDYAKRVYDVLRDYDNFKGGFLTWEDFWGVLRVCDLESEEERIQYSAFLGYQRWLMEHLSLDEYNERYLTAYGSYESVPVPHRDEPAMESMYCFYDDCLMDLLSMTQQVFPNISMEVRLDADVVTNADHEQVYFKHSATYACGDSDYTATMYGIPMGFKNEGELVSAQMAAERTQAMLEYLLALNDGKPIYIDQFIFSDNTPEFSYNAQIKQDEIDDYLEGIDGVLKEFSAGYAIWTYRDYRANMIYNNGFALEDAGWDVSGGAAFETVGNSIACRLSEGQGIAQAIPEIRNHFDAESYTFSFDVVDCVSPGEVLAIVGNEEQAIRIDRPGRYALRFDKNESMNIALKVASGELLIDNVRFYSFVQQGFLYDEDNQSYGFIESIRKLNRALSKSSEVESAESVRE